VQFAQSLTLNGFCVQFYAELDLLSMVAAALVAILILRHYTREYRCWVSDLKLAFTT